MKRFSLFAVLFLGTMAAVALSQPPQGGSSREKGEKGAKGEKGGSPMREKGPPPKFELGKVLPPHVAEQLKLTKAQEKDLAELEKIVKEKLDKILTDEQKKSIDKIGPPMGGPGGGGGPGGPPMEGDGPRGGPPSEKKKQDGELQASAGIQWFTTLEQAKQEAARTGRPILLVSAAPHCGGVSGIW